MCDAHRSEASIVTASRIGRARASNRAGWRALGKASATTSGVSEPGGGTLPASPDRSAPQRTVLVRQRAQVQALLRTLSAERRLRPAA